MQFLEKLKQRPLFPQILLAIFVIGFLGSLSSLFAQYVLGMNPCVMCIQQRVAMMVMTVMALLCLALPTVKTWAKTIATLLVGAPVVFGAYIASKQVYIQSLPITEQPSCGAPWTFRLRNAPLFDLYEPIIRGTGVCGEVYKIFGVSLPMWALLFFSAVLLAILAGWVFSRKFAH